MVEKKLTQFVIFSLLNIYELEFDRVKTLRIKEKNWWRNLLLTIHYLELII